MVVKEEACVAKAHVIHVHTCPTKVMGPVWAAIK
jgi:hypothetical protein